MNLGEAMANDDKEDERDPNQDPVIAGALERMQRRLKPGEDPFFYDINREQAPAEPPEEGQQVVYVAPKTLPPVGEHKTIPNARVMVADPRKMPTLKRIDRPGSPLPDGTALEGDSVDAVVSPVEAAAPPIAAAPVEEPSPLAVGPRGTAKMATVTAAAATDEGAPSSSRREPAASPWAKEAEETPLLARDLPSSHAPGMRAADDELPPIEEKKRSKLPILLVFAAILLVAFIGVRFLSPSGPTTNATSPTLTPMVPEAPDPTVKSPSVETLPSSNATAVNASPSASASAEEEAPSTEAQGPASATAAVEAPRPKATAAPKPSAEPAKTAQPAETTAPSGPKFVPPFQFPDEKKK